MDVITAKDLTVKYGEKVILHDVNVTIPQQSFVAILGENGAGKTTLIKALLGQNRSITGQLSTQARQIGYVPQFRSISRDYPLSIRSFVGLGFNHGWQPWYRASEKKAITRAIAEVDLTDLADNRLGLVSGGQKQRAFVAQALAQEPDLLILDESTASLDARHSIELVQTIVKLQQEHQMTVLWITHDTSWVKKYADYFLWVHDQQVTAGPIDQLPATAISHGQEEEVHNV
ncbi:metal ABC transporter ATP-binding protein [Convivina intestini]|uniref:Zinc/manganese transport system ATP-binding protein n=1 Tax=Convivina intestini TaxID=1505726 RepID=A0A2U1DCE3_9LACO|nr:ABC transporter ATP-binding protein [Convivina intestini]PVY85330.1 zinc/manganese transport system ATP-binding protein [Convivina intestini]CAH1852885.1 putative siderophore transport system ATP-binding protein YusV [Convivina intestini]SDB86271.1 zinc/manganese transport system ATP-binding protein [Leuconostocaceae bacterium R-53105]